MKAELIINEAVQLFQSKFGKQPECLVRAPGRVNLIGEHTDYNEGYVLPIAIDKAVYIAIGKTDGTTVRLYSNDMKEQIQFDLQKLEKAKGWGEYFKGVAWALQEQGFLPKGWHGVLVSDIPQGAGLSSSAAVEMATVCAFSFSSGLELTKQQMALIGRKAENDWVGVKSGIMDQMISSGGVEGHALLIDCRTHQTQTVPLSGDVAIVVMDSATRHALVASAYNDRRRECEEAARFFGVSSLRDVSIEEFHARQAQLDPVLAKRARHVITENDRVLQFVKALQDQDEISLGRLLSESHASLRDDYEVSSQELNEIVACALEQPGCLGARMTGAGFGGCAIALVKHSEVNTFEKKLKDCYLQHTGLAATIFVCKASQGAGIIRI